VCGEFKVRLYSMVAATFSALKQLVAGKQQVRVTFVHDRGTGNKLFADKAWYVRRDGQLSAFLLKDAAQAWAKSQNGSVIDFETARATVD
jgi:NitT/TauT family transport system substrate-binding protein